MGLTGECLAAPLLAEKEFEKHVIMNRDRLYRVRHLVVCLILPALAACASASPASTPSPASVPSSTRPLPTDIPTLPATKSAVITFTPEATATINAPVFWFSGPDVSFQEVRFTLPSSLASEVHALAAPAAETLGEQYPPYLQFTLANYVGNNSITTRMGPQIAIYPVGELGPGGTQIAQELNEILTEKPGSLPVGIPVLPVQNAGQLMDVQVRYLTFANGSGLRVLTQFAQNAWPIHNEGLLYVFQGLTSDHAYYISVILPVSAPFLPDKVDDPASIPAVDGVSFPAFNSSDFAAEYSRYRRAIQGKLNSTGPEEFTPSLNVLDELVASFQVKATTASDASPAPGTLVSPCLNGLPTRLRVGLFAYVDPDPPLPNNLRTDAGKKYDLVGAIEPGKAMKILEGPKCADGWVWWKVRAVESKLVGWTPEGSQQEYWLIPCTSQKGCRP